MHIFINDKLKKQLDTTYRNRKDIKNRFDDLLKKIKSYKTQLDCNSDKGFKPFKNTKYPVFGFDIGLHDSSTTAGERLIVSFVNLEEKKNEIFKKVIDKEELEKNSQGIILHMICAHDDQNKMARRVNDDYINNSEYIDGAIYFTNEDEKIIEESFTLESKYEMCIDIQYSSPRVTVLSLDKYGIIDRFIYESEPMLVRGIAGSGKTEITIKAMHDLALKDKNKRILYVTLSLELKDNVSKKSGTFEHSNIRFETVKSLYDRVLRKKIESTYEEYKNFEDFIDDYKRNSKNNYELKRKIINFLDEKNNYNVYSEIYGLIFGYMQENWSRKITNKLSKEEYLTLNEKDKKIDKEEQALVYEIATLYETYCLNNNLSLYSHDSIKILNTNIEEKYDYIFIDEVQDLTEVQIAAIYSLISDRKNIFLTGDEKQIINPTFFKTGRIYELFRKYHNYSEIEPLNANFRNSKSVTELINYCNDIRKKKLPALKQEYRQDEISKNKSVGNIYNFIGNPKDLEEKINGSANSAIIVDEKEYKELKESGQYDARIIFTASKCKGIEFDNVFSLNMLSSKKDIYNDLYIQGKNKDNTLHHNFNLFYVAITRTINSLVIHESEKTYIYDDILDNVQYILTTDNVEEINLEFDKDVWSFINMGKKNLANNDYERALLNFEKAKETADLEQSELEEIEKYIDITNIYLNCDKLNLASEFEKNKHYEFALKHYEESNNYIKSAMMCLLLPNSENRLKRILVQEKINIFDLYSDNQEYNKKIDEYFKSKYEKIQEKYEEISINNELIKEQIKGIEL